MPGQAVVDIAGGGIGGAARWSAELTGYLAGTTTAVTVLGADQRLTAGWLLRREWQAAGAAMAVAANNASFAGSGAHRRVVLRNALHFLHPDEAEALSGLPRSFRTQIAVVRRLLARADTIIVPSAAMADRVRDRAPAAGGRIVVRPHPVTPVGPREPAPEPFLLVPVLPAPYKNLVPELTTLLAALDRRGSPLAVRVTAGPAALGRRLARHPRVRLLGTVPHRSLARLWQRATAAFFPSTLEAFGYPLAEARVYGVPVLAPDRVQAREIAGAALRPYRPGDLRSVAAAVDQAAEPVAAEPDAFDRDTYFRWLLGVPARHRALDRVRR